MIVTGTYQCLFQKGWACQIGSRKERFYFAVLINIVYCIVNLSHAETRDTCNYYLSSIAFYRIADFPLA